ncbi:energy-coupling factor transporter transmembrane component T family protein [Acetonema longum]|uniref:Energy-coupling factor transporter transmembrane protein EcfT n=1 Tax=Acetonema longum DSM 6540 TaxID=1009370 RepID=F7NF64_9FIRM|nr:energy-coupling factor transporter transmembrane component T [Acetonema longum]EGO65319.1 cobalt transporter [Acetonema longum DSM 6540]
MLNNITLGQYFPGQSFVHRLDPRSKIIGTLLFISAIFLAESYVSYLILAVFCLAVIGISGIPLKFVLKSIRPLWLIILITVLIHFFTTPGRTVFSIGPLTVSDTGLEQGILMSIRLVFLIVMSSLMTFTTSPIALTDGIEQLLKPLKRFGVPAHELAMMMTIALRFIPTLIEETDRIMKAQISRGAEFGSGNILRRAQSMIPLLVPLFISAFRRADELATAMEARCYRGGDERTRMKELQFQSIDLAAALVVLLLVAAVTALKWFVR